MSGLHKSHSCTSLADSATTVSANSFNNYLTVHSIPQKSPSSATLPIISTTDVDRAMTEASNVTIQIEGQTSNVNGNGWTTMTPQEVAIWIDKRSRFVFPIAFVIFNIFYWTFVYYV
ncbi:AGAP009616-PA [Anopheles gambiae str. PEST]|nr:AGAP009616-PA [Anopheles gambiae str. PEST]